MDLREFQNQWSERQILAKGRTWGVIDTGGGKEGNLPVLVFLPGTLGTAEIFWNQIAELKKTHRVLSLTYPALPEITDLADGLAALLLSLGIEKANILGSSLGGYLAQVFASRHPETVQTLFLANTLSDPAPFRAKQLPSWLISLLPASYIRNRMARRIAEWSVDRPDLQPLVTLLQRQLHYTIEGRALKARVLAILRGSEVGTLSIPHDRIVIIESDDDPLIPPPVRADVKRRYPGAAVYQIESGGHFPYVLRADRYTTILQRHLTA